MCLSRAAVIAGLMVVGMKKFQTARRCRLKIGADYSTMWVWEAKYCFKI
ncbi:Hypothetical protein NGK_0046 [Neisseria gonorrhoeae NCCP11945]|uniref:Uncharacterized protein n=1 Tax=Neisseria gonorrhoeae (strain NCCP11945) TaxID=521006 RepID=B4RNW9_NEIG2|nr:Hypothetical protein NGK_0046 [Neisseria gonorrhoeae NCCP11945]